MNTQAPDQVSQGKTFKLHPIDQHVLEQTGGLPGLDLLVNPELLRRLRAAPPSVHTIETKSTKLHSHVETIDPSESDNIEPDESYREDYTYRGFLLRPRMESYVRALELYAAVDGSFGGKFSSRLQNCRRHAFFFQHNETKKLRVVSSRCKLRWCPICRDVSRMIVTKAVDEWLRVQKYPKMLTLTLKHSDEPLQFQIDRLYKSFQQLKKRAFFKRRVKGGVWFFQLKLNLRTEQWHPHIHCLIAGDYLPHSKLKTLWRKITNDSDIIDIRPIKDLENASSEVARYATSPADITRMDLEQAADVFYSTKNRRICGSWGSAKSVTLKPTPQDDRDDWIKVADFYFVNVQKQYDNNAMSFWKCYKRDLPYDGPQIQNLSDVFKEELDILLSLRDQPETYQQFQMRIREGRKRPWTKFFEEN